MRESSGRFMCAWTVARRRLFAEGPPWLRVWCETVELPDGRIVDDYYQVEQPDHVAIFAVNEGGKALGIRHYKHGPRRVVLGLPAGYMQPGEDSERAARRELLEETGCEADRWESLGSFSVDGNRGCGRLHVFLATGVRRVAEPAADDLEEYRIEELSLGEMEAEVREGRVGTLTGATAILLAVNVLRGVRMAATTSRKNVSDRRQIREGT